MLSRPKKLILIIALICFTSVGFLFAFPRPAKAQWIVNDPSVTALMVQKEVKKTIGATIMQTGTIALVNALNYFVQKLAYDAAVWVAAGGSGQKSLFDGKSTGEYFEAVASDAFGTFVDDISKMTQSTMGFDLCQPSLSLLVKIQMGIWKPWGPPTKPVCNFKKFVENWDEFTTSFKTGEVLKNVGIMFEPGQNELSYTFEVNNAAFARAEEKQRQALMDRLNNKGWQDVKDAVTKRITTPANVVRESFGKSYFDHPYQQQIASFGAFGDALGRGAWQVLPAALQTFANTLIGSMMKKLTSGLFSPYDLIDGSPPDFATPGGPSSPAAGKRKAQEIYSDFIKPRISESSNYDPLIEFTVCPTVETEKQINNCVLDDSFASAIRLASQGKPITINEAIKQGYLDGNKPLISSKDSRNEEKNCYQKGYCYSNLVKLRKVRILPVGFELAAEVGSEQRILPKLKEVVDAFDKCEPRTNSRSSQYPYCHLIDPNWVLRLPKTQCKALVYGPALISTEGPIRAQVCADTITCISEDEDGKCTGGWGYCTKERNIWRISADKCSEQYNTCLAYKPRISKTGKIENYLRNTVRFDSCVASNAGCRPYSVNQSFGVWSDNLGDEIYFNKDVEKCDSKNAGCTELYSKDTGLAYNMLPNSSFENLIANQPVGWKRGSKTNQVSSDGSNSFDGDYAINISTQLAELELKTPIKLELNTPYTVSAYVKGVSAGGPHTAIVGVKLFTNSAGTKIFNPTNLLATCNKVEAARLYQSETAGTSLDRISCAFLTPSQTLYAKVFITTIGNNQFWVDAAQLEEGIWTPEKETPYLSSGYGDVDSVYMKVAPDYLSCDAENSEIGCSNYAYTCKETEVGCELYTPKDGSPGISGIATINDTCSKECVGYETFKQEEVLFEQEKFPLYLIPTTAKSCTANDVGCDEFTNIETEAKEYFSFLRQCIKPGDAEDATFYTWEGSDTVGYQLRSHKLKIVPGSSGNPVPAYIPKTTAKCNKTIFQAKISDANYNPDCREFYNADGKVSYRLLSRTIISTSECTQYRKTESDQTNCNESGGVWDTQAQYCVYKGYEKESTTCASSASGCRAYIGAFASNMRIVLQDDFEAGVTSDWNGGTISSEALSAGGHSLKSLAVGGQAKITKTIDTLLGANSTYTLSFWAKAPAGGIVESDISQTITSAEKFDLAGDWKYFEMGQIQTGSSISGAKLQFTLTKGTGFYIDNIILKEVSQNLYLIKNSWTTPASCDQTTGGLYLPQAMLGCKEYSDSNQNTVYLKSFSSLCRDSAVGCKPFQNTYNSASDKNEIWNVICARNDANGGSCGPANKPLCNVGAGNSICRFKIADGTMPAKSYIQSSYKDFEEFQAQLRKDAGRGYLIARDESTVEVPADKTIYLVEDEKKYCQSRDLGCSSMGQSELYEDAGMASPVYYRNEPDNYSKLLCTAEAEGCESWTSAKGIDYFKVPEKTCEYKEAGVVATGGWVKEGTTEPCYSGMAAIIKDGAYGIWRNADNNYDGSVGICPTSQNGCTELIDPFDTSGANKTGKPYYIIDNAKFQELENHQDCDGNVSLTEGCVLFNKTSDTTLKWHALATYFKADKEKTLVAPVSQLAFCGIWPEISGISVDPFKPCTIDRNCPKANTPVSTKIAAPVAPGMGIIATVYTGKCEELSKDANTILKVTRDRECGEWLTCKTTIAATDPITNTSKPVCAELGLCNKYQASSGNASCANFLAKNSDSGRVLDAGYYSSRNVSWDGMEYSGYSIGKQFPITDIKFKDIGSDNKDIRMFGKLEKVSYYDVSGNLLSDSSLGEKASCRGYPEPESPFPASIGQYDINGRLKSVQLGFQSANLCDYGQSCECDYTKLTYGSAATKKYTTYVNRSVPAGICQGGPKDGEPCKPGVSYDEDHKNSCGKSTEGGTCLLLKRQDDVIGWEGYCVERDLSTPINGDKRQKACLTWLSQDLVPGARDIYNQFKTAGYTPPLGAGKYYCLQATGLYDKDSKNPENKYDNFLKFQPHPSFSSKCGGLTKTPPSPPPTTPPPPTPPPDPIPLPFSPTAYSEFNEVTKTAICGTGEPSSLTDKTNHSIILHISDYEHENSKTRFGMRQTFKVSGQDIYKNMVDLIRIKVLDSINYDIADNTVFYMRSDKERIDYIGGSGAYCNATQKSSCIGEENIGGLDPAERAVSLTGDKDRWYFRYDDGEEHGATKHNYIATDLFDGSLIDMQDYCDNDDGEGNNETSQDAFALRFNFDSNDKLTTVDAAVCTSGYEAGGKRPHGARLEISVRARELCEVVVDVAASENMANTQTLWQHNPNNTPGKEKKPGNSPYHYGYEMQPFGSAQSNIAPSANENWYSYYTENTHRFAGVPWSCKKLCGTPLESDQDDTTIDFNPNTPSMNISMKPIIFKSRRIGSALNFLSNIFGKVFKVFRKKTNGLGYTEIDCAKSNTESACELDNSGSLDPKPAVFSYDPSVQLNNNQYQLFQKNRLVINNKNSGNISVNGNQFLAVVRFYAWADSTQMPLTSIKVDWEGNGKYNVETTDGRYKNHKPRCAASNTENVKVCRSNEVVCRANSECPKNSCINSALMFGNSPDACEEGYFELQHIYTCDTDSSSYYPSYKVCEFYPEIIVTDNWESDNTAVSTADRRIVTLPKGKKAYQTGAYYDGKIILKPLQ